MNLKVGGRDLGEKVKVNLRRSFFREPDGSYLGKVSGYLPTKCIDFFTFNVPLPFFFCLK